MKEPFLLVPRHFEEVAQSPPPPARPRFGFLLGGTTLGIFFGCILLCAGASPPLVILSLLSILGALTGGILEAFWPMPSSARSKSKKSGYSDISVSPFRDDRDIAPALVRQTPSNSYHECHRCGEVFEPAILCPMCGHAEKLKSVR